MKKLLKVALVALCVLFAGNYAKAQSKIGYISQNALFEQMPEYKTVRTQLDAYQKQFVDQLTAMNTEFQTKVEAYNTKKATMTDATKTATETELGDMQKRLQEFEKDAQNKIQAKGAELSKPIVTKARAAITQVAKEKGYAYVLDSSQTELLVSPDGDDLLAAVKLKLGLK